MERFDIRGYLYHGIANGEYKGPEPDPILAVFESILKDGYLLFGDELKKRNVYSNTCYDKSTGWSPRISLGFYPLNNEVYTKVRNVAKHKERMPIDLKEYIMTKYGVCEEDVDSFVMNCSSLDDHNFAWQSFYYGTTLIFDPSILDDIPILNYAAFFDEACVDQNISLRKYLVAVAFPMSKSPSDYYDEKTKKLVEYEKESYDVDRYKEVLNLLKNYGYDVPIIDFETGRYINECGKVLVRIKKTK